MLYKALCYVAIIGFMAIMRDESVATFPAFFLVVLINGKLNKAICDPNK